MAKVAVIMGSDSDWGVMQAAVKALKGFGVEVTTRVLSAHRTPELAASFAKNAAASGYSVIIAGAGKAAHLAGVLAGHTTLPVIGVPLKSGDMGGMDALLATVQMPPGVPVATVAVDGAQNAAILAVQMMALADDGLAEKLQAEKRRMEQGVAKKNEQISALADQL